MTNCTSPHQRGMTGIVLFVSSVSVLFYFSCSGMQLLFCSGIQLGFSLSTQNHILLASSGNVLAVVVVKWSQGPFSHSSGDHEYFKVLQFHGDQADSHKDSFVLTKQMVKLKF